MLHWLLFCKSGLLSEARDSSAPSPIFQTVGRSLGEDLPLALRRPLSCHCAFQGDFQLYLSLATTLYPKFPPLWCRLKNIKALHCAGGHSGHNGTLRNLNGQQNSIWTMDLQPVSMKTFYHWRENIFRRKKIKWWKFSSIKSSFMGVQYEICDVIKSGMAMKLCLLWCNQNNLMQLDCIAH